MNRRDPRIRQTLDRISSTLDSAKTTTQASLFTFSQTYLSPCLTSLNTCLESSCYPCIGAHRDRLRARQNRLGRNAQRGHPELVFDFYNDDWDDSEEGESTGLLGGWGTDELDRLLAGSGDQPRRQRPMNYGSRGVRRKSLSAGKGGEVDPTIVPGSSMFGFLERLPWKIGSRGVKYKPSAADLQDHPGRKLREEGEALLEESEGDEPVRKHGRKRSGTNSSRSTSNSLSSRGDLFPSEDEADAVALDDEFATALGRRNTLVASEETLSGRKRAKRPITSRSTSTKTSSSKGVRSNGDLPSMISASSDAVILSEEDLPSMEDLREEEEQVREEEEAEVERKRQEAQRIAFERGLATPEMGEHPSDSKVKVSSHPPTPVDQSSSSPSEDISPSNISLPLDLELDPPPLSPTSISSAKPEDDER